MRVALIIDTWFPTVGGGQINAFEISKRLALKDISIDIITRNTGAEDLKLPNNLKVIKLGDKVKPFDYLSKIFFLFSAYSYIYKQNYDLVHAHAFLPGIAARLLSIIKGIPTVFTVHGTSIGTGLNNFAKEWLEKFILTGIRYDAQISVSQDFLKLKNVNRNIYYIPNGVEARDFDKVSIPKAKDPTLIFVGRLHPQKNLPKLIKAINLVKKDIPNIKLIVVGDGAQKESFKKMVKALGLMSNISFKGEVKGRELVKLYKASHVFILPSIYEGQPLTVLEAWAARLPVLATKTGDCQFLVKDGINGYLINDPKNPEEIVTAIKKTFQKNNLEKLGTNGYQLVRTGFTWENAAAKTLEVYKK